MIVGFVNNFRFNNGLKSRPCNESAPSNPLLRSPSRDEVCFGSSEIASVLPILRRYEAYKHVVPEQIQRTSVLEKFQDGDIGDVIPAFIVKNIGYQNTGMNLVTQEGYTIGCINNLDKEEFMAHRICPSANPIERAVGRYLRIKRLLTPFTEGYKGVGTAMIEAAKEESHQLGYGGQLKVFAYNDVDPERGCPVPFYAKNGFIDPANPYMTKDELVEQYSTPDNADTALTMYHVTPETLQRLKKIYDAKKALQN